MLWTRSDNWLEANGKPGAACCRVVKRLLLAWVLEFRAQASKLIRIALMVLLVLICSWNKDTHPIKLNQNVVACRILDNVCSWTLINHPGFSGIMKELCADV